MPDAGVHRVTPCYPRTRLRRRSDVVTLGRAMPGRPPFPTHRRSASARLTCEELVVLGYGYPYARETGAYLFVNGANSRGRLRSYVTPAASVRGAGRCHQGWNRRPNSRRRTGFGDPMPSSWFCDHDSIELP